jgi:phosphoribosyl 1,2-cyclic phosphate phosphodiesterase
VSRQLTVLGSGTSFGVPVVGCSCDVCTSADSRDRRTRTAAVIDDFDTGARVLIDTPPELRIQLVERGIGSVDAVLFTHDHADHVHGIDDLRALSVRNGTIPVYGPADTLERLSRRFDYIFDPGVRPPKGSSKPELTPSPIPPGSPVTIAGMEVLPLLFGHGHVNVFGYRVGPVAYLTDVKTIPQESRDALQGVRFLVLNALFTKPHPTHLSIPEATEFAQSLGVERTFLTHLTHRYSHASLLELLPAGIEPAYDGLTIPF